MTGQTAHWLSWVAVVRKDRQTSEIGSCECGGRRTGTAVSHSTGRFMPLMLVYRIFRDRSVIRVDHDWRRAEVVAIVVHRPLSRAICITRLHPLEMEDFNAVLP